MKRFLLLFSLAMLFFACSKDESVEIAPVLPPVETMVIDFGNLGDATKSASVAEKTNWLYSAVTVGTWSSLIGTTFAIPVAAFRSAIDKQPVAIDNLTWQWQYEVEGFTSQYTARLVGKLLSGEVKWEMYITKTGIDSFDEFLWFEGTSKLDGTSGQWILYQSAAFPEKMVQIDWMREDENVGQIKYTYIREKNELGQTDKFNGSTITYGLQSGEFDIYVNVHAYLSSLEGFNDTMIEWSTSNYTGHVKDQHFYENSDWHCWDSQGNDISCD